MNYTKNNQLIAEFMGWSYIDETYEIGSKPFKAWETPYTQEKWVISGISEGWEPVNTFTTEELLFHTSWDWLMPVVEKIESIEEGKYQIDILQEGCRACVQCQTFIDNTVSKMPEGSTKLESAYKTVIDFINWYNENK